MTIHQLFGVFLCGLIVIAEEIDALLNVAVQAYEVGAVSNHFGGASPGELSHSLICEPVSACRAFRSARSRSIPGGSDLASSRRRCACSARRSSRGAFCLKWRRCVALLHEEGGSA
jgi:hypothetical protein